MPILRNAGRVLAALFFLMSTLAPIVGQPPIAQADGGTFPDKPFYGIQVKYDVDGATLGTPVDERTDTRILGRSYTMQFTGRVLTVSGTVNLAAHNVDCRIDVDALIGIAEPGGNGKMGYNWAQEPSARFKIFRAPAQAGVPFNQSFKVSRQIDPGQPSQRTFDFFITVDQVCSDRIDTSLSVYGSALSSKATPIPPALRTITGKVQAKDVASWKESDTLPIGAVKVDLLRKDRVLGTTISNKTDGSFTLRAPITDGLVISVSLSLAVSRPAPFVVVHGQSLDPVSLASKPFTLTTNSPEPAKVDLVFGDPDKTVPGRGIPANRMADLGAIYYYIYQAWETAAVRLKQELDYDPPLFVRAFGPCGDGKDNAFWTRSGSSSGLPDHPTICLDDSNSNAGKRDFVFTPLHEFGHHLMGDAFGNDMPRLDSLSTNHGGFRNPSSSDAWKEGFATFNAGLVQRETLKKSRPELLPFGFTTLNLDVNYSAWLAWGGPYEEWAVMSLLWDLVDPIDANDATPMQAMVKDKNGDPWPQSFGITLTTPITVEKPLVYYADRVQMDLDKFWATLTKDSSGVDRSPGAPSGYKYIYDVRQLYSVLKASGVGADKTPNGISALDELFIAHGYFADTAPQNLIYDPGEVIGFTNNLALAVKAVTYPKRDVRRSPPPIPNSYISFDAVDGAGNKVEVTQFKVEVRFDAPFTKYNYSFDTTSSKPGQLYFVGPDPRYPVTSYISVVGPNHESTAPLVVSNDLYWKRMAASRQGSFMTHTFKVKASGDSQRSEVTSSESSGSGLGGLALLLLICVPLGLIGAFVPLALIGGVWYLRRPRPDKASSAELKK